MLVLSRKEGETIRIGEDIEITVVRVSGNRVRVGISAPRDVTVTRPDQKSHVSPPQPSTTSVPRAVGDPPRIVESGKAASQPLGARLLALAETWNDPSASSPSVG